MKKNLRSRLRTLVIGNFTYDKILINHSLLHRVGGGVFYSIKALSIYNNLSIDIVSWAPIHYIVENKDLGNVDEKHLFYTNKLHYFTLNYSINGDRSIFLENKGYSLMDSIIPSNFYDLTIVDPVFQEVNYPIMKKARIYTKTLAIDIQGFIRSTRERTILYKCTNSLFDIIELADIIHMNNNEYLFIVNKCGRDPSLYNRNKIVIVTNSGNEGFIIFNGSKILFKPYYVEGDETGAGDTFLAHYSINYITTRDAIQSLYRAAIATACTIVYRDNKDSIIKCIEEEAFKPSYKII